MLARRKQEAGSRDSGLRPYLDISSLCVLTKKIGRELTPHKGSASNLKYLTNLEMSSPDLSAVGVQRSTWGEMFNANPNVVRVPL